MTPHSSIRPQRHPVKRLDDAVARFGLQAGATASGLEISGIAHASDDVHPGDLFVGLPGATVHGARFSAQARAAGAIAVVTDAAGRVDAEASGLPVLVTDEPRALLGELARWVYDSDAPAVPLLGVTGTNGKSSTVHLIVALFEAIGRTAGLSSTTRRDSGAEVIHSELTTPEATDLQALLARMREVGVDAAVLEVSAQAVTHHRSDAVVLDVVGFTGFSHDHLDDYPDMEAYFAAKLALFRPDRSRRAVVMIDSAPGRRVAAESQVPVVTVSTDAAQPADWHVEVMEETRSGVAFALTGPKGSLTGRLPVIGRHMAANAALAIAMMVEAGFDFAELREALGGEAIDAHLPGRSEYIAEPGSPAVFVDSGHSPEAFEKTLAAVRAVTGGKVIFVFGADGGRDTTKRPAMAEAAVTGSDMIVITDHHVRFEDPAGIRTTLVHSAHEADPAHSVVEVADPKEAIRHAVSVAGHDDSILWSGLGGQTYRYVRGEKLPFSAQDEARAALREAGYGPASGEQQGA